ncbi:oligosaccharide flippase family protein [Altererythrobacter rubellus]|uniref:Oligosaccharide flippase family protein n=1 Tax=Altererythrobacter rubellus TaxID=2173831 RepID=A0A9Y2B8I0_9SPHN|nr:oligosaccharide flippase family protein [Altererythrobacter rubellus]WIW95941.1 oligosaccharide flippase family protein [Altererythrobacter rubellus]
MGLNKFLGQGTIYLFGSMLSAAVPFLLLPFLARWLGPADFGVVGNFVSLVGVLGAAIGLSTHGYIPVAYYRDGPQSLGQVVGGVTGISLMGLGGALFLVTLFGGPIEAFSLIPAEWLWLVALAAAGQFLIAAALAVFQTLQRPWAYITLQISYAALLSALSVALILFTKFGWEGRAMGQVIAVSLVVAVAFLYLSVRIPIDWRPSYWPLRKLLRFGAPLLPHAMAAIAMASMDRFILTSVEGARQLGFYVAAAQIASLVIMAATAGNQAWLPWLYGRLAANSDTADRELVRMTYLVFACLLATALGLILITPWLMPFVAGSQFVGAVPLLRLLALATAMNAAYLFVAAHLFYHERTGLLSVVSLTAAVFQFAVTYVLGKCLGVEGVAGGTAIGALFYWLLTWTVAARQRPLPWFRALRSFRH